MGLNIQQKIKVATNSNFAKNISTLVSGTVLAQLIPILIQPVLRRYYPEEVFGAYAVYMSLLGILYVVTSLRYEQAIVIPKDDQEAKSIFATAQLFNLALSLLLFILVLVFKQPLLRFLNIPESYSLFLFLAPIAVFLFNQQQSINLWLIRKKKFIGVSSIKIIRRGTEGSFQILFRFLQVTKGLVIGDILGHIANNAFGLYKVFRNGFNLKGVTFKSIKTITKKYNEYPKFNTLPSFLNSCSLLLPTLIINKYYGAENAAYYDLSRLLLLTPVAILASSISNVMLQRVSEKRQKGLFFSKELKSILLFAAAITVLEVIVILPFGEELFSIAFGINWEISGTYSKIIMWAFILYFTTLSLSSIFLALQRLKALSIFQFSNFLLVVSLLLFSKLEFSSFLKIFTTANIISSLIFAILLAKILGDYKKSIKKPDER